MSAPALIVKAVQPSRRRAGFTFGPVESVLPLADLTDDQISAIDADPLLIVSDGTVDAPVDAEAAKAKPKK
jgi:hypothetical protein